MRKATLAVLAVIVLGAPVRTSQQAATVDAWLEAVRAHTPGRWDRAAEKVGGWTTADLGRVSAALASRLSVRDPGRAEMIPVAFAGAQLHTDIAVLGSRRIVEADPKATRVLLDLDGRSYGRSTLEPAWPFVRTLLDPIADDPARSRVVRSWYVASASWLASQGSFADLIPHLERARSLFPEDPTILLDSGCMYETIAAARMQAAIQDVAPAKADLPARDESLRRAEYYLSQAIEKDPRDIEARVRRDRVRTLRGRPKEALVDLRVSFKETTDPFLKYHAAMFLGAAFEALDEPGDARRAYDQAAAVYPFAQSPRLALAALAVRRGDRREAMSDLEKVLRASVRGEERADQWWVYSECSGRRAGALLEELRRTLTAAQGGS